MSAIASDFDTNPTTALTASVSPMPWSAATAIASARVKSPGNIATRCSVACSCSDSSLIAPIKQRRERLMPRHRCTRAAIEHPQPIVQMRRKPCSTEYINLRGGEFDRQRHAIQTPADLTNGRRFGVAELKPIPRSGGSLNEKLDRRIAQCLGCGKICHVWRAGERRQDSHPFALHAQAFAAGGKYVDAWRTRDDRLDQAGGGVNDMLTVVEYQQHLAPGQEPAGGHAAGHWARRPPQGPCRPRRQSTPARLTVVRSTKQTPSRYEPASASAQAIATLVLPMPPGPTTVTWRRRGNCSARTPTNSLRPISRDIALGNRQASGATAEAGGCAFVTSLTSAVNR